MKNIIASLIVILTAVGCMAQGNSYFGNFNGNAGSNSVAQPGLTNLSASQIVGTLTNNTTGNAATATSATSATTATTAISATTSATASTATFATSAGAVNGTLTNNTSGQSGTTALLTDPHLIGSTILTNGTAGMASATITTTGIGGRINIVSGTTPSTGILATVTYGTSYPFGMTNFVVMSPGGAGGALLTSNQVYVICSSNSFTISSFWPVLASESMFWDFK